MTFNLTTLPSGLRIATVEMPFVESVTFGVFVDAGSRFESEKENGISHFLEHMAFKGTKTRTANQIAVEFDAIGGISNAYTSQENTVYFGKVLKENLPKAAEIIADILQNSVFDAIEMERERDVILQEIAMHRDSPDEFVFDIFSRTSFAGQALGRTITGDEKSVRSFSREDLISYMGRHYNTSSMLIIGAGKLTHDEMVAIAKEHFSSIRSGELLKPEPAKFTAGSRLEEDDYGQTHVIMGFPGCKYTDSGYYTMQVAAIALGGGMSSRLFQKIREEKGLAYSIYAFSNSYIDTGVLGVHSACAPEKTGELIEAVAEELVKAAENFSMEEIDRAKAQLRAALFMSLENTTSEFEATGRQLLYFGRYIPPTEIAEKIEAVTPEAVAAIVKDAIAGGELALGATGRLSGFPDYEKVKGLFG